MTLKTVARQFCLKGHCVDETFRNGKGYEDKGYSVSSPSYKV